MEIGVSPLERAFQLARSGAVRNVQDIVKTLRREGYDVGAVQGRTLTVQLKKIITVARESARVEAEAGSAEDLTGSDDELS